MKTVECKLSTYLTQNLVSPLAPNVCSLSSGTLRQRRRPTKKYLWLPQPQIFTTLAYNVCLSLSLSLCFCRCRCLCLSIPTIIYTLLIFHHVTTVAGCLFGCFSFWLPLSHSRPALSYTLLFIAVG